MTRLRVGPAVAWLPWSPVAFARARDEEKPVLLALTSTWSTACREMDRLCYDDPAIVAEINRWCIPVRVDADRRPDIAERYELGGLPTTAFLNEHGDVLGGGTFVPPERFAAALRQLVQSRGAQVAQRGAGAESGAGGADADLVTHVFSSFDHEHGGFTGSPKFPLTAPVRLAIALHRETGSEAMADYVRRTLDAMAFGGLYDDADGGFFRCAAGPAWEEPAREKLLGTNAALIALYLEAGIVFDDATWLERASGALAFVNARLAVGDSQGWRVADGDDTTGYSDLNATMVSSALAAFRVTEEDAVRRHALESLEAVLLAGYRPGEGVAHHAGGVRGLLADQVAMAAALLDAFELTGDPVYQMMAQELVEFMLRALRREDRFVDRVPGVDDVGRLADAAFPFVLNCEAAVVLSRLATAADEPAYARTASAVLDAVRGAAAAHGPLAAHYLLARRALSR